MLEHVEVIFDGCNIPNQLIEIFHKNYSCVFMFAFKLNFHMYCDLYSFDESSTLSEFD